MMGFTLSLLYFDHFQQDELQPRTVMIHKEKEEKLWYTIIHSMLSALYLTFSPMNSPLVSHGRLSNDFPIMLRFWFILPSSHLYSGK